MIKPTMDKANPTSDSTIEKITDIANKNKPP
jgi:hypothetical protein